ncbi:MAG: hypothetical protein DRN14_03275 [Thermoplasmata archaeon]|nr:MAG: hypothetical protein DRN14_03275 [Thermoplasmata archaeon]
MGFIFNRMFLVVATAYKKVLEMMVAKDLMDARVCGEMLENRFPNCEVLVLEVKGVKRGGRKKV